MKKDVLGVKIDDVNSDQAVEIVKGWLKKSGKHQIVTPNPEIVVMAQKDKELLGILNRADLAIPDGAGLKLGGDIVCNTSGIDLLEALIKLAEDLGLTTGFLGGRGKVAEKTAECLRSRYPKLKISFAIGDIEVDEDGQEVVSSSKYQVLREKTNKSKNSHNTKYLIPNTDLLFVAFGPPKQEKWISKNISKLPVKVAMGVGGAFDVLSGKVPRAPSWVRNLNLEWLFRLTIQPWRIKRQVALIKYLWLLTRHSSSV